MNGNRLTPIIETGQFLDVFDTHYWKATQLASMTQRIREQRLDEDDVLLVLDAWNPAIEALAYMRDAGRRRFKIVGLFHAGTYDPWDFLTQARLERWAEHSERGWVKALDAICVATHFHRNLLGLHRTDDPLDMEKIYVTGFPMYAEEWQQHNRAWEHRPMRIVFPHRVAPEKGPELWDRFKAEYERCYPNDAAEMVMTRELCKTKEDYYSLLGSARVAMSFARQETWGIAMLEAQSLGCYPVAPRWLSYPETCPQEWLYSTGFDSTWHAVEQAHRALHQPGPFAWDSHRWLEAIPRIAEVIEQC